MYDSPLLNSRHMENTEEEDNVQEWRDYQIKKERSLEDQDQASEPVEHTIYEEKPMVKKIRLEYVRSVDSLEKTDQEFVEPQGVVESTLYCECGDEFEKWEAAVDHVRELRD